MTDNEIIKALELCANRTIHSCKSCPCNGGVECNEKLNGGALDLINRQKAEIEKLQTKIAILKNEEAGVIPVAFGNLIREIKGMEKR